MADRDLIPRKAQMPLALILGVFFLIVLVWRFGGRKGPAVVEGSATGKKGELAAVSIEDLNQLLIELDTVAIGSGVLAVEAPPLERNPFLIPVEATAENPGGPTSTPLGAQARSSGEGDQEFSPTTKEGVVRSRSERLSELRLSATSITRDSALALVNGMCMKEGDMIAGFVVKEINEREVILEDGLGTESVRMPEI